MNSEKEKPSKITFSVWSRAPLDWSIYWTGLQLNRLGGWISRLGGLVMAAAVERLARKAGLTGVAAEKGAA